ncbi:MAG: 26 kDa periplasmic immunogenic protein [Candidatus Nomurabacteria bacterium GW2011_GWB1_43_7]|uniref:26 kDa periplasmic immunogenic protein n=2 Tax=Candidatus Nomuraibacteriota TaxID=1752729 RepID=A0A0G1FBH8_9BACT|nr:MAG: 26 kDa periplasmic immunogenic protein [Candidatus Nomurabacteria bacterium GW2011_GWB1_43_7]KKT76423.1 MAG: 26 kDa periplasmic immunogenic protein [Parcubacteria group bacterium GW2011_GWF2_44_7]
MPRYGGEQYMEISGSEKSNLIKIIFALGIILSLYFLMRTVSEIKSYNFIGGGAPASNTISFSGKGEVSAAPDLATVSFTIRESAGDIKSAQSKVTAKESAVLDFLDNSGIAKKDIKTENYSSYPKYDYGTPCYGLGMPCRPEAPKIIGYEVSEYVSVKVHDLTKAGEIIQGIGAAGVSEINGPDFSIENEEGLKEQARKMAIDEAKVKAKSLSRDLGVRLVRIVNFSENGDYPVYPMYEKSMMATADSAGGVPAPTLPMGENKITSNVTITYEIR